MDLTVSMQHLEEIKLGMLVSQETHITVSSASGKIRRTRECAELDMVSFHSMRDLFATDFKF